ncbi:MAG TPA: hypothetical protein VI854_04520 [Acidimicrobiia bacterium]|nr:hypothetical protein [Acidimicrobiia bacterium]
MERTNPFRYGAPVEDDSFCDRAAELGALGERMRSGIHAFVLSPRRYGKTSLLLEALRRFRRRGGRGGYANLLFCTTDDEVAATILTAVVREVLRPAGRARHNLEDILRHVRLSPRVSLGPDGNVTLSFGPDPERQPWIDVLHDAVGLLGDAARRRPTALVLDEFQQVAGIGPQGMAGAFKALADEARGTSLVFSGSHLTVMERLTRDRGAPLLGMGEMFRLDVVPEDEMAAHLVARAAAGGKRLAEGVARHLYRTAGTVPNDVQWLAHAAFEAAGARRSISVDDVAAGLSSIVARQAAIFAERYEALAPVQRRIVRELARRPAEKVYAKAFLDAVRVANANAVTVALKSLAGQELVRRRDGRWELTSPFFAAWLAGAPPS